MKIFTRNGRSFKITEELYKKLQTVKLYEDGDLTANPQTQSSSQQNPQQNPQQAQVQQDQQEDYRQQLNNENQEEQTLNYKIANHLMNKLMDDEYINAEIDTLKSEVLMFVSHMSFDQKKKFNEDYNYYKEQYSNFVKLLNSKYPSKSNKIYDTINEIVSKVYRQLDSVLKDFNKDLTKEINDKLNTDYETVDITSPIISGLEKKKDLVARLKDEIINEFDSSSKKQVKEAKNNEPPKLVDKYGNELKKEKNSETNSFIKDKNTYLQIEKYIKDDIYNHIIKKINDSSFKENTLRQSSELGDEWVDNILQKLVNVIKYGVYNDYTERQSKYGAIELHNYTEDQYNEIWNKLKSKIKTSKPTNECDEMFKLSILKMIDMVDSYDSKISNDNKNIVKKTKKSAKEDDKEDISLKFSNAFKGTVFSIYNDYSKILDIGRNESSTRKVNKNFVLDIINDSSCMDKIKEGINELGKSPTKRKIVDYSNFIKNVILEKFVFGNKTTTDANYDTQKYSDYENFGKNKKVKEVVSINKKYNAIFLTEKKSVNNKNELENVSLFLEFLNRFETVIYSMFKNFYTKLDSLTSEVDANNPRKIMDDINNLYDDIVFLAREGSTYNSKNIEGEEELSLVPMMVFSIVKKVIVAASNFAVENIDNYVDAKINNDTKKTKNPSILKQRTLDKFQEYMGRKPLQSDVQHYKETLEKLKSNINKMKDIDAMFEQSASKRYFYKVTDYFLKTNNKKANLDIDLLSAITSLKRGKGNSSEEFLNSCIAFSELGNYYTNVLSRNKNNKNDYFDDLVNKIFENNEVITNNMINSLFHEVWISNSNLSSAQLITIMIKNPALKEKYEFNQEYDVTALYSKKPVIIIDKSNDEFIGVLSFISIHNIINALKNIGSFDFTKIRMNKFKGRNYT